MPHSHVLSVVRAHDTDDFEVRGQLIGYETNAMVHVQVFLTQVMATASGSTYARVDGKGDFTLTATRDSVADFDDSVAISSTGLATEVWTTTLTPREATEFEGAGVAEHDDGDRLWRNLPESWDDSPLLDGRDH